MVQAIANPAWAQGGPPPELRRVVDAAVAMLKAADMASTQAFSREHLDPSYRAAMGDAGWLSKVETLRGKVRMHGGDLAVEGEPGAVRLVFGGPGGTQVRLAVGSQTGWKVAGLDLLEPDVAAPNGDPRERAVMSHARAIEAIGTRPPELSLQALEARHFVAGLFRGPARDALLMAMADLRPVIAGAGMINLAVREGRHVFEFRGERNANVVFAVEDREPHRITAFEIDRAPVVAARAPVAPLQWEALASRMDQAEKDGFAGVVLALRQGQTVLARGFGRADPQRAAPPTLDSVYDIGSMPIDFTRAAVLWLAQEGRLSMDDTVGRYFPDAPADKAGITLAQLMDGSAGLANFHFRDTDTDKDLAWIDRTTALARIFAQPLLFAPGSGRSHSHSAFGVLAAVIEQVSGRSYGDFLRERVFGPAGMVRSGFYGDSLGLPDTAFAVGAGKAASTPNIPPRWGRASWLVMGSGGMVSSVADMRRGFEYIASGRLLRGEWLQRYRAARVGIGGSERGFLFLRVTGDDGSAVYVASHSHRGPQHDERLVQELISMVLPDRGRGPGR